PLRLRARGRAPVGPRTREVYVKPDSARVWFEGLVTGFLGYFTIVVFYGLLNLLIGQSFFHTAALLGRGLVEAGPAGGIPDPAGAVLAFNGLHLLAFLAIGLVAAWLVMQMERHPALFVLALFLALAGLFLTLAAFLSTSAVNEGQIPFWSVAVANLLAGTAMALYLLNAHPRLWVELRDHVDPETEHPTPR
ncbi:MAG: hypothetical protein V3T20_03730, partial [Gemmatimonadota bacterium]